MSAAILVVGLAGRARSDGWERLVTGRAVLARWGDAAARVLPPRWSTVHRYDELFDAGDPAAIAREVADDVLSRAEQGPVAYLTPGIGYVDRVAQELAARSEVQILAGMPDVPPAPQLAIVDALVLAEAHVEAPFEAGLAPLDPTVTTLVTGWHGRAVTDAAAAFLRRHWPELPQPRADGTLLLPGTSPLDGARSVAALQHVYARLRRPDGCPWDREQGLPDILRYLRDETDELAEAVERGDWPHAAEELGDVLGNVIMLAQVARENGRFELSDAVVASVTKLVRRHPHVFGDLQAATPEEVLGIWSQVKARERDERAREGEETQA